MNTPMTAIIVSLLLTSLAAAQTEKRSESADITEPSAQIVGDIVLGAARPVGEVRLRNFLGIQGTGVELIKPKTGHDFRVVVFKVKSKNTLQPKAYILETKPGESFAPIGICGGDVGPQYYSVDNLLAEQVRLEVGAKETAKIADGKFTDWDITAPYLTFLYQVPADSKSYALRYGSKRFDAIEKITPDPDLQKISKPLNTIPPSSPQKSQAAEANREKSAENASKPKTAKPTESDPEKVASNKLTLAKKLLNTNKSAAKKRLEEIVNDFEGTAAAKEAEDLLKSP